MEDRVTMHGKMSVVRPSMLDSSLTNARVSSNQPAEKLDTNNEVSESQEEDESSDN